MNRSPLLILASSSPRRQELLKQVGLSFTVIPSDVDETTVKLTSPESYVRILAELKAKDISERYPHSWVIGADTIVLIDGKVMGKPVSYEDARNMLRALSGKTHQVLTGYCIRCHANPLNISETMITDVVFKKLTDNEIDGYLRSGEPFDKAGAYAIQGMGSFMVQSIRGSYASVVGLPVCEVVDFLSRQGIFPSNENPG